MELDANGISSMAAYLSVELDSGDVARFYLRYENPTKKAISVAEASVTFIEVKYDEYAEEEYDKAAKDVVVETSEGSLALNNKVKYAQVKKVLGEPNQETDGRFHYSMMQDINTCLIVVMKIEMEFLEDLVSNIQVNNKYFIAG